MKKVFIIFLIFLWFGASAQFAINDSTIIETFSFSDPSPEGWGAPYKGCFQFPSGDQSWEKILMVRHLKCDSATKGDQYPCGEWDYITETYVEVQNGDSIEKFQLGSFVTPYGKRLTMGGEAGWKWVYDVTDYAPLLNGRVNLVSGNNQELLKMTFIFIKGTPMRKVYSIENLYEPGLYKYGQLATDSVLPPKKILLDADASGFMLRARISGHGHNGPRNCCEWDSKTHSYYINEWEHFRWNVWTDCGFNPIYPQGGTWPFDRAGWCPGTKVDEYDFELSQLVSGGDSILIDYGIEMYKDNGESGGEFRMSHQLISFGPPNFKNDARMVAIITPSSSDSYSRINPICGNPRIIIQNSGAYSLYSVDIRYGLEGGELMDYQWSGQIEFLEQQEIWLPTPSWNDLGENQHFMVEIIKANGLVDDYSHNNKLSSIVKLPTIMPEAFSIYIESTNKGRAKENAYTLTNAAGTVIYERSTMTDSTTYEDRIQLEDGCYTFRLTDDMEDGMNRHWWNYRSDPEQVGINGKIEFHALDGSVIQSFPYDFGQEILFRFRVGELP